MTYLARWFTVWFLSYSLLRSTTSQYTVLLTQNDTWHKIGTLTRVQMVNFLLEFVQCHFAEEIFIQCRFEVRISFYPFILKKSRSSYAPQNLGVTVKLVSVADALTHSRSPRRSAWRRRKTPQFHRLYTIQLHKLCAKCSYQQSIIVGHAVQ